MLGAIIGDIAGSFREQTGDDKYIEMDLIPTKEEVDGILTNRGTQVRLGMTDDSLMTIATGFALFFKRKYNDVYHSFGNVYFESIGGFGAGFRKWLDLPPVLVKPYNSCGNGAAMRVSPIGYYAETIEECLALAFDSAICTHNHPEGIKGAQAVAAMVFYAKQGLCIEEIMCELENLHLSYEPIEKYDHFDKLAQETMRLVTHVLIESADFEDAIFRAVTIPHSDSDTIGAIVGSVAELLFGIPDELQEVALTYLGEHKNLFEVYNKFNTSFIKGNKK